MYQRQKSRDGALSSLDVAIETMNLVKEVSSLTPAKVVFGSVCVLLTMIRDSMANELEFVELGLFCADICTALNRGVNGRRLDTFSQSVRNAINQLMTTVAEIERRVVERGGRNAVARILHAKNDGGTIAAWKLDLSRILHVFNTELAMNTHVTISDVHNGVVNIHTVASDIHNMLKGWEGTDDQHQSGQACSIPGELPPPPPRAHFGRGELVGAILDLAESLTPIALIGAGGIGKTSTALTVLHSNRIKQRFGDNRWFVRCDQFPASLTHFLHRLSVVIGAGVEHPDDLIPLRRFLSSREHFLVLDNAESVLDPLGTDAKEVYAVVEELSQFSNVCLCLTSRISIVPPTCETLDVPTLSMEAARDAFYCIYKHGERSGLVDGTLEQLDFHPLSVTLLATVAHHNKWDTDRLTREWERRRTDILHTQHDKSLAATVELSLASPMFQELGPDARGLLGVVAFFPQGVGESSFDWLSPNSDERNVFDNFCILSLTYRSNGFVTMLAPLRDYLCPKDPKSSRLLCTTRDHYLNRLSVEINPGEPGFEETGWVASEDLNIEHLLDVFTTIDADSNTVWDACAHFMDHLYWHKPRLVVLGPKIEGLPDDHPSKPQCLFDLSQLLELVGDYVEARRLLVCALELWREWGDDRQVARTLVFLAGANRLLGLRKEGVQQAEEGLEICERLGDTVGQAESLQCLARLLYEDNQLDAAEEATSKAIYLSSGEGNHLLVCQCRRLLGDIYYSKDGAEKAVNHFETALAIASSFNWHVEQFWIHYSLAELSSDEGRFGNARTHLERAKSHAVDDAYLLGRAMRLQAEVWHRQRRFEEARSEILCAAEVFEKLGAALDLERCREVLQDIQEKINHSRIKR